MHPAEMRQDPYSSAAAIQQLVDLGYLPAATTDAQQAIQIARAESQFNLAVVHLTHGRPSKARLLLEPLREEFPQEPRYAERLAKAYLDLGLYSQAQETMETLEARGNHSIDGELILAAALANQGDGDAALSRLEKTARNHPPSANLQYLIGSVLVSLQRWPDAQAAFARGVALDPDHAQCLNGLAQALLNLGEYERAAENAMQAIGLLYFYPQAHFHLGAALAELGEVTRAIRSMEIAVTHSPQYYEAHRRLAELYERDNNPLLALKHHRLADGLVAFD